MAFLLKSGTTIKSGFSFRETRIDDIPNLEGWWKAGTNVYSSISPLTPATNGGTVYRWIDTTANARNFDQATSGDRPTLVTGNLNGYGILRFSANTSQNKNLTNTSLPNSNGTNGASLFIVAKYTGTYPSTTDSQGGLSNFGSWTRYPNASNTITDVTLSNTSRTFTPTLAINQWRVISVRSKTNLKTYHLNNELQDSTTTNTYLLSGTKYIGTSTLACFIGDVADVLFFSRYVTDDERSAVATYLMNRYGLT